MEVMFLISMPILIVAIIGLLKENKIRAKYKGVFGRIRAYLFINGIGLTFYGIIMIVSGAAFKSGKTAIYVIIGLVAGLIQMFPIAIITKKNCPEYLQKGLFLSMFWAGIGITFKIALFFLPFIWRLGMPTNYHVNGSMPKYAHDDKSNACHIITWPNGTYAIRRADGTESPVRKEGTQLIDSDGNCYYYQ